MKRIISEIDEIVKFYSPEVIEEIARETGFVERESKFGGVEFLGIMTFGLFNEPDASLDRMAAMAMDINPDLEITGSGIHQRIAEAGVKFLETLLAKALEMSVYPRTDAPDDSIQRILRNFQRVCVLDSTYVPLPDSLSSIWRGSGGDGPESCMKLQLMIDYKSGTYMNISPTDSLTPDQNYITEAVRHLSKGDLLIFDLGYVKKEVLFDISFMGAYFLSRLNHQLSLYEKSQDGESFTPFDLVKELKVKERKGVSSCEFQVWLQQGERELKIRVIAEKAPDELANARRREIRRRGKERGYTPSGRYLYLQGWNVYMTSAEAELLPTHAVSVMYGVRWHAELVFKAWKSYHGLCELKGKRPERIECFIYGRLIMATLMTFLSSSISGYLWMKRKRELSFFKTIRHFKLKANKALSCITDPSSLEHFLRNESIQACRLCVMNSRKRLSTADKVRWAYAA